MQGMKWVAALAMAVVGILSPNRAHADKLITGTAYSLTFPASWDTIQGPNVVGKLGGFSGIATLGATAGTTVRGEDPAVSQVPRGEPVRADDRQLIPTMESRRHLPHRVAAVSVCADRHSAGAGFKCPKNQPRPRLR